jgi:hypothetical protein
VFVGHHIYRQAAYGRLHPLTIPRVEAVVDLIRALDWFVPGEYVVSPRASIDELERRAPGGRAALWQVGHSAFGFASHPGLKVAMVEDLVMEFDESAPDVGPWARPVVVRAARARRCTRADHDWARANRRLDGRSRAAAMTAIVPALLS